MDPTLPPTLLPTLLPLAALLLGGLVGALLGRGLTRGPLLRALSQEQQRREAVEDQLTAARTQEKVQIEALATLRSELESERRQSAEKLQLLDAARQQLSDQFRSLAEEILDQKSRKFTEQNQQNLTHLLQPLRENIDQFRARVETLQSEDARQQALLQAELGQLKQLNQQLSAEAHGLAVALKGESKTQGNWGELILENVLDRSGLRAGIDFEREVSLQTEDGRRRPDVLVRLPENRHLVIDAKVSLNAYTRYVNAEDPAARQQALAEHVRAIRQHILSLSDRSYFALPGLQSPEMVFMFIPVESAFVEALRGDASLFQTALEKQVLVATPTTLLTSLNIVRQLWRFEQQNANAAALAEHGAKLYKKLVGFVNTMERVRTQLATVSRSFDEGMGQLSSGRGNVVKLAHDLEQRFGVAAPTRLPEALIERAELEADAPPSLSADAPENTG
jgi:DNA recombination protein RmuC